MSHHTVQVETEEAGREHHGLIQTGNLDPHRVDHQQGPHVAEDNPKYRSDLERANILSQLTFAYVGKVIWKAFKQRKSDQGLQDKDLTTFPYRRRAEVLEAKIERDMFNQNMKKGNKEPSLTWAIIRSTKWDILRCIVVALMFSFVRIFTGWVLKELIDSYTDTDMIPFKWAGAISACLIVGFFLEHHYNHIGTYFPVHVRGALVSMIYTKVNKLSTYTLTKVSAGQVLNIASNDVNVFDEFGVYFPKLLVAPIVIIATGALLWIYFGVLCLVGLGYIVMWFPIQALYIVKSEKSAEHKNHISDDRVKLTRESIEGIRLLKMYTWELRFKKDIFELRNQETRLGKKLIVGESIWRGISFSSLGIATFLIYMPYYLTHDDDPLTPGTVFSTYYLFSFLRLYGAFFVNQGFVFLVQAGMVIHKIEKLLLVPEIGEVEFEKPKDPSNSIEFEKFNGYWTKSKAEEAEDAKIKTDQNKKEDTVEGEVLPTIKDIQITIKKGSLNAVVGAVGSGKTSFLMSLTGEMPKTTGSLRYKGTIAYVEQEPTIFAGTFRESICFGRPYEPEFYSKVIKTCNLETDLSLFPNGDMSMIGEKGNNLSGGQKARLALARAVYADADIYLLDDPLSAVDPKVASSIFNNCISGILKGKTVLLVTHQVDFAKSCDHVIMMKHGRIMGSGPFEGIKDHDHPENKELWISKKKSSAGMIVPKKHMSSVIQMQKTLQRHPTDLVVDKERHSQKNKEVAPVPEAPIEEDKQPDLYPGKISAKTYFRLASGMGGIGYLFILIAAFIAVEMTNIAYGRILAAWLYGTFEDWKCLAILGGLVGFFIFIYFVKYILLNVGLVRTTQKHHEKMLDRIIQAPVYFYDSNPIGQILNRFSNDTGTLDRFLPLITMDVLDNIFFVGSVIIFLSITDPVHLGPLAGEVIFVFIMMKVCFQGVKQTKKYEMATKGPLFSLFSASLSGLMIIRTYNQAETFKKKFAHQLHTSLKGSIGFALTTRFLAFYVDMGYNLAELGVIFIMTARVDENISISAFGLALVLSVSGILQYTLRQFCMANILIESAARIQSYWEVPNEAPLFLEKDKELQAQNWPQKGDINFNHVFMRYSPTGPNVIKDLTLHAEPAQRIGCVGRTGAGKTSILQLLFRLQEVNKDSNPDGYIKIDDVDTSSVGLHALRGNISIIPQIPFILTGTVRYNVDPLGKATDEEVWKALKDVRLKKHVEQLPQKLDTQMTAATSVFSVGQKQLVCLARSILKPSPIMIMDEATANMDQDTDTYVTNKIRQTFDHSTTFTIAHRLSTIANYDRVLVLDKGSIKEFDEPYKLLVTKIGDNDITNKEGHFASMVNNTGPVTSKHIFELAKQAYDERHYGAKPKVLETEGHEDEEESVEDVVGQQNQRAERAIEMKKTTSGAERPKEKAARYDSAYFEFAEVPWER